MVLEGLPVSPFPVSAPVSSEAAAASSSPPLQIQPPPVAFDPEASDNALLRFVARPDVEVLEAKLHLSGDEHTANLASGASVSSGQALIDLGGPRPFTRVIFTPNTPARLMIQLGGAWFLPGPAGAVTDFNSYVSSTQFPELVTEKVLLSSVTSIRNVESITLPTNVTLRAGDGGVPFFFQRGGLRVAGIDVPDFAEHLDLAIRSSEPVDGGCSVDLIAHSDTFGTVVAEQPRVTYRALHNTLDGLTGDQRTLMLSAGAVGIFPLPVPEGTLVPVDRPPVSAISLDLVAMAIGPLFAPPELRRGAVVSASFQVAQAVDITADVTVVSINLLLQRRSPGSLRVDLRLDADREPRGAVLASASPTLVGLPDAAFDWLEIPLDSPAPLKGGRRVWIVVRTDDADVEWAGDDTPSGGLAAMVSLDRGNSWQVHPLSVTYAFRLALPAPLTFQLELGDESQAVLFDPSSQPVAFDSSSPLVAGLNTALTSGRSAGQALPSHMDVALRSDPPLLIQVTLTRFDVALVQDLAVAVEA
ncbi:MAG TPA: hypothetical protein VGJ60_15775 [Chloroflexota bacterium]|jgi:hypothetical protein